MFRKYQIETLIILCALIIGTSIYVIGTRQNERNLPASSDIPRSFRPIDTDKDIILGNPKPKLFIVEYGDLQCKFCREIHPTLKKIITGKYGINGSVAWVWRHGFHVDEHSVTKARGVECVRSLTGERGLRENLVWKYIDDIILVTDEKIFPNERTDAILDNLKISRDEFSRCIKSETSLESLKESFEDVIRFAIEDTPFIQFINKDGELLWQHSGVLTEQQLLEVINAALENR